ncbi:MAG: fused response regulator/phosphatase [Gammaproteobacteria bacterium]|nr:fused response regulator/phosphatase [Gammaproteobacteria bacterium]
MNQTMDANTGEARRKILAIDDSPEVLDTIHAALQGEFQLLATVSAHQGVEIARRQHPDLILLDVVMDHDDGFAVCQQLKNDSATRDIPVIFVTSLDSSGDELRGFAAGAVDFVSKPIVPVTLRARVRSHIELSVARKALHTANDQMAQERKLIAEIVLSMLNDDQFHAENITWSSHSCDTAGGDLVLSALRPNGDQHILLGDFTGHGLSAAVGTPLVAHLFYSLTAADQPFEDILVEINNVLVRRLPLRCFMASAAVRITSPASAAEVWSFGNPDLLHRDSAGHWSQLSSWELPMGIQSTAQRYEARQLSLDARETLYLLTDGPIEAVCKDDSMFGIARVREALERHAQRVEAVIDEIVSQAADPHRLDDLTILKIDGFGGSDGG